MATKIVPDYWQLGVTIYHSADEHVSYSQLEAEGRSYAKEHYPGRNCTITVSGTQDGDYVHIAVKE